MSYKLEIKGLRELQAKLEKLPQQLRKEASGVLERGAQTWVRNAKRAAPVDDGILKNQISYAKITDLSYEVISGSEYSAYNEWGTITRVRIPAAEASYAIQFKGKGIRKTGGMYPNPFFFPQQTPVRLQIEQGIAGLFKDAKL